MNFGDVCRLVHKYQQSVSKSQFEHEIKMMEMRVEKAKEILKEQYNEIGGEFRIFWESKVSSVRMDMIDKVCKWVALTKGSDFCGIPAKQWQNQWNLYTYLCIDLKVNNMLVVDLLEQKKSNTTDQLSMLVSDEHFVAQELRAFNIEFDDQLIRALCSLKRFIQYFVVNSVVTMFRSLKKANLVNLNQTLRQPKKTIEKVETKKSNENGEEEVSKSISHQKKNPTEIYKQQQKYQQYVQMRRKKIVRKTEIDLPEHTRQEINQYKLQGNDNFRKGDYKEAVRSYSLALALLPKKNWEKVDEHVTDELDSIDVERILLHANRAAAFLKMGSYHEVIAEASLSLRLEPNHVKSLYRRAQAYEKLKNYEQARRDYAAALRLSPGSRDLMEALIRVKQMCKQEKNDDGVQKL